MATRGGTIATALTAAILLVSIAAPGAAAPGDRVALTLIHAYAPNAEQSVALTVCIDDAPVADLTTAMKAGPFEVAQGSHRIAAVAVGEDCTEATPVVDAEMSVGDIAEATVVLAWGPNGGSAAIYAETTTCTPQGLARLTLRNASALDGPELYPQVRAVAPDTTALHPLTAGAVFGGQAASQLTAGVYTQTAVQVGSDVIESFGTVELAAGTDTRIYVYGGADGRAGAFSFVVPVTACPPATTVPGEPPSTLPGQPTPPRVPVTLAPVDPQDPAAPTLPHADPATPILSASEPTYTG